MSTVAECDSKFDWSRLPEEAQYAACDWNGEIYCWDREPEWVAGRDAWSDEGFVSARGYVTVDMTERSLTKYPDPFPEWHPVLREVTWDMFPEDAFYVAIDDCGTISWFSNMPTLRDANGEYMYWMLDCGHGSDESWGSLENIDTIIRATLERRPEGED